MDSKNSYLREAVTKGYADTWNDPSAYAGIGEQAQDASTVTQRLAALIQVAAAVEANLAEARGKVAYDGLSNASDGKPCAPQPAVVAMLDELGGRMLRIESAAATINNRI